MLRMLLMDGRAPLVCLVCSVPCLASVSSCYCLSTPSDASSGELSSINGVAGSFAESIPIIHIVGKPSTAVQKRKALVHHSISAGRYDQTTLMYSHISAAQALLTSIDDNDGQSATAEIDRAIRACVEKSKPVYISLPMDLVFAQTSSEPLKNKLTVKSILADARAKFDDHKTAEQAVSSIVEMYKKSSNPCLVVDFGVIRFHLREQVEQLVKAGDLPFFTTPLGKGALDEDHTRFKGVYLGTVSEPEVQEQFDGADFVLFIGPLNSDLNTGSFTYKVPQSQRVELHSDGVKVQGVSYLELQEYAERLQILNTRLWTFMSFYQCSPRLSANYQRKEE